ncbi:MAG: efflux RND transporter periplasmic adaptor subunit [Proteobacteria bacterium]|nr:efflux RND transporter periplasmic adaptor subunit [Pseudomonadota bacterium]
MNLSLKKIVLAASLSVGVLLSPNVLSMGNAFAQGPNPEARAVIQSLSPEERQKFFELSTEDRRAFIQKKLAEDGRAQTKGGAPGSANAGSGGKGKFSGKGKKGGKGGRRPPAVELGSVVREELVQTFPITGRLIAKNNSPIATTIKGRVAEILVDVGDVVKAGDVLARLDTNRLKLEADLRSSEVLQARAKWKAAEAQVDLLGIEMKRLERLRKSAAFSQARYDDKRQEIVKARTSVDETAAALQRARAQRDLARIDVKDADIKAPFDGSVTIRHTSPGAYINPGNPVVTLLDNQNMEVEADVPSTRVLGVPPGATITVRLDEKTKFTAKVRAVIPNENPLSRTRAVRLVPDFGANVNLVVPNQSVVLEIPQSERRMVISVEKDAIVTQQTGPVVFVFQDGRVRPANVEIGASFSNKFEILSGLQPGQQVVIRGNELLRPNQPVRVTNRGKRGAGGKSKGGGGGGIVQSLSPEERQKFFAMEPGERRAFIQKKRQELQGATN